MYFFCLLIDGPVTGGGGAYKRNVYGIMFLRFVQRSMAEMSLPFSC